MEHRAFWHSTVEYCTVVSAITHQHKVFGPDIAFDYVGFVNLMLFVTLLQSHSSDVSSQRIQQDERIIFVQMWTNISRIRDSTAVRARTSSTDTRAHARTRTQDATVNDVRTRVVLFDEHLQRTTLFLSHRVTAVHKARFPLPEFTARVHGPS